LFLAQFEGKMAAYITLWRKGTFMVMLVYIMGEGYALIGQI
jgi:hypothetical protein